MEFKYMDNELFKAAEAGDWTPFNKYHGDYLRCLVDGGKNTALHIYCRSVQDPEGGEEAFIQKLVDKCPLLLLQHNEKKEIPMHIAAKYSGNSKKVESIIECSKHVVTEDVERGFHVSDDVSTGSSRMMYQMLRMSDSNGNTPLHNAFDASDSVTKNLLINEVDSDFPLSANKAGETPLYIASKKGQHNLVAMILEKSNTAAYGGPNGTTALHAAVLAKSEETVKILIQAKRDLIKETDSEGRTPLHYAAHLGLCSIVKVVLETDATVAYIRDNERGTTALHMAAWRGNICTMKHILLYCPGCLYNADKRGWNFLHFAVVTLSPENLERFLFCQNSIFSRKSVERLFLEQDIDGNTPLHVMVYVMKSGYRRKAFRYLGIIKYLQHDRNRKKSRFETDVNSLQKELIPETLKEIGEIEVAGKPVHESFAMVANFLPEWKNMVEGARQTHLLVATLIATVTFAAAIQVPGGYNDDGTATLTHNSAFKAFIITDALSFVSSLTAISFHFACVFIHFDELQAIRLSVLANFLTVLSMAAMVVAFSTGTYAVLHSSLGIAISTCFIGLTFFSYGIFPLVPFIYFIYRLFG